MARDGINISSIVRMFSDKKKRYEDGNTIQRSEKKNEHPQEVNDGSCNRSRHLKKYYGIERGLYEVDR